MTWLPMATPATLAGVVAKGTLLLALGWGAALILRRAPAGARHIVWLTVIVGVLLIPALAQIAPMNVPVLPRVVAPAVIATPARDARSSDESAPIFVAPSSMVGSTAPLAVRSTWNPSYASLAFASWLLVALVLLVRLVLALRLVRKIMHRGRALNSAVGQRLRSRRTLPCDRRSMIYPTTRRHSPRALFWPMPTATCGFGRRS